MTKNSYMKLFFDIHVNCPKLKIKEDWEYFLETTKDGTLIMGRRCYEEYESFADGREVIALSRNPAISFARARRSINE